MIESSPWEMNLKTTFFIVKSVLNTFDCLENDKTSFSLLLEIAAKQSTVPYRTNGTLQSVCLRCYIHKPKKNPKTKL